MTDNNEGVQQALVDLLTDANVLQTQLHMLESERGRVLKTIGDTEQLCKAEKSEQDSKVKMTQQARAKIESLKKSINEMERKMAESQSASSRMQLSLERGKEKLDHVSAELEQQAMQDEQAVKLMEAHTQEFVGKFKDVIRHVNLRTFATLIAVAKARSANEEGSMCTAANEIDEDGTINANDMNMNMDMDVGMNCDQSGQNGQEEDSQETQDVRAH